MNTENSSQSGGGCPFGHGKQAPVTTIEKCPVENAAGGGTSNQDWWPNQLKVDILHQHDAPVASSSRRVGPRREGEKVYRTTVEARRCSEE